jgi:hypothetical protein
MPIARGWGTGSLCCGLNSLLEMVGWWARLKRRWVFQVSGAPASGKRILRSNLTLSGLGVGNPRM